MNNRGKKLIIWITAAVAAVAVMAVTVSVKMAQKPEFIPPEFEPNAKNGVPTVSEDFAYAEAAVGEYKVFSCAKIIAENGKAKVFFTNDESNDVWVKIRIVDANGEIIGESGLLNPGEYVEEVLLTYTPEKGTTVRVKVMLYEPHTYQSEGAVYLEAEIV